MVAAYSDSQAKAVTQYYSRSVEGQNSSLFPFFLSPLSPLSLSANLKDMSLLWDTVAHSVQTVAPRDED